MTASGKNIVVFGTGRSGTTWLAQIVAAAGLDLNFEPLDHQHVPEARQCVPRPLFVNEHQGCPWEKIIESMLRGEIRNPRLSSPRRPGRRVVTKLIRANLIAPWIVHRFDVHGVFIVRNPLAVVSSMREQGWYMDPLWPGKLLSDARFSHRFFAHRPEIMELADRPLEDAEARAVFWAVTNFIPMQMGVWNRIPLVRYEDLVSAPRKVVEEIFPKLDLPINRSVIKALSKPSSMPGFRSRRRGYDPLSAWRQILSPDEARSVIDVVERFDLQEFLATA